jgi:deoxyribodipyrimidine photolyase-related protein
MAFLIFPNQLFYNLDHLNNSSYKIFLIEEPRYFTDFKFHKLKLAYHRASMKKYFKHINKKYDVEYIDYYNVNNIFYQKLAKKFNQVIVVDPTDHKLKNKLEKNIGSKLVILETKNFLIRTSEMDNIKKIIFKKKYSHDEFYKYQRKKLNILMDSNKPIGGKWSYDYENRLPLPKNHKVPKINGIKNNSFITEAKKYVEKYFPDNYGSLDNFIYPIDNKSAINWLKKFLNTRLHSFGTYEDAVSESEPFIYHSVLSPMMNIGILTDTQVINISWNYYLKNTKKIPLASFEGFIRQVIGWRNYVYTLYCLEGKNMMKMNQLKHNNKLPEKKFWLGQTEMKPIDSLIHKINNYAYVHHIERLMYLGNFMLLCQINPNDVYKIFMEWCIDSYEWVMVANVYGMSQFSTDIMMTRPYFSSSNYIHKMSSYKRDSEWDKIWDALYYNFIDLHKNMFKKNYAIAQQVKHWENKSDSEKKEIKKISKEFLSKLL